MGKKKTETKIKENLKENTKEVKLGIKPASEAVGYDYKYMLPVVVPMFKGITYSIQTAAYSQLRFERDFTKEVARLGDAMMTLIFMHKIPLWEEAHRKELLEMMIQSHTDIYAKLAMHIFDSDTNKSKIRNAGINNLSALMLYFSIAIQAIAKSEMVGYKTLTLEDFARSGIDYRAKIEVQLAEIKGFHVTEEEAKKVKAKKPAAKAMKEEKAKAAKKPVAKKKSTIKLEEPVSVKDISPKKSAAKKMTKKETAEVKKYHAKASKKLDEPVAKKTPTKKVEKKPAGVKVVLNKPKKATTKKTK